MVRRPPLRAAFSLRAPGPRTGRGSHRGRVLMIFVNIPVSKGGATWPGARASSTNVGGPNPTAGPREQCWEASSRQLGVSPQAPSQSCPNQGGLNGPLHHPAAQAALCGRVRRLDLPAVGLLPNGIAPASGAPSPPRPTRGAMPFSCDSPNCCMLRDWRGEDGPCDAYVRACENDELDGSANSGPKGTATAVDFQEEDVF